MKKIKGYFNLIVPQYSLIIALSIISSELVITGRIANPIHTFISILALSLSSFGLNALNQVYDLDIDRINKPGRPIVKGVIKKREALLISVLFFSLSSFLSFLLGPSIFLINLAFIILAVSYCVPALRIRHFPFASNLVGGTLYSAIPFVIAYSNSTAEFPFLFFILFYFLGIITASFKDFEDVKGDARNRLKTIPVVFGTKKATGIISFAYLLLFTFFAITIFLGRVKKVFLFPLIISVF